MKWTEVVQDCCQAVEMNPRYVKALFRRAKALERLDNKKECLEGECLSHPVKDQINQTGILIFALGKMLNKNAYCGLYTIHSVSAVIPERPQHPQIHHWFRGFEIHSG
jgi:hypothetical protein